MDFHERNLKFVFTPFSMKPKYRTVEDARHLKKNGREIDVYSRKPGVPFKKQK